MQSSFSRGYDREVDNNGFVNIRYKARRFGARGSFWAGWIMFWAGIPASCAVTSPIVLIAGKGSNEVISFPIWAIASLVLVIFVGKKWVNTNGTLQIQPGIGLDFEGKQLPYEAINDLGTASDNSGRAYVYANTQGREVKITRYISKELADAIKREIMQAGGTWGETEKIG